MSLHVRQLSGRKLTDDRSVEPPDGMTDAQYLAAKAASHGGKGWEVKWSGPARFRATKKRWARGTTCTRTFWID